MSRLEMDICKILFLEEVRNLKNPVSIAKLFPKTFFTISVSAGKLCRVEGVPIILIPRSLLGLSRNQNKQEGAGRTNTLMLLKRGQKTNKTHSNRLWTIINPHTITQTVSNSSKASLNSAF